MRLNARSIPLVAGAALVIITSSSAARAQDVARLDSVSVNGITQCYREAGTGPALLLLHGFGNSGVQWLRFLPELVQKYRVIMPDLRGHGCSTNPTRTFTHRQAALDIYALLDSLRIRTVAAIGASSGAMTLLHMATSQPARISELVLVAGTTHFPDQARPILGRGQVPDLSAASLRTHPRGEEQIRQLQEQFNAFQDSYDDMTFTPQSLGSISARTLIIHGDRDHLFPVEIAVSLYRGIRNSQLYIVPNGGHSLMGNPSVMSAARAFLSPAP